MNCGVSTMNSLVITEAKQGGAMSEIGFSVLREALDAPDLKFVFVKNKKNVKKMIFIHKT